MILFCIFNTNAVGGNRVSVSWVGISVLCINAGDAAV